MHRLVVNYPYAILYEIHQSDDEVLIVNVRHTPVRNRRQKTDLRRRAPSYSAASAPTAAGNAAPLP